MKKILLTAALILVSVFGYSQKVTDDFSGNWKTEEGVIITITKMKDSFIGLDPNKKQSLYNVHFKDGLWKGIVANNKTKQTANCEIYLEGNKLKIIAHKGFFSKTIYWTKQ